MLMLNEHMRYDKSVNCRGT